MASAHATSKRSGVYCVSVVVLHASVIELHTIDLPEAEAPDQKSMPFYVLKFRSAFLLSKSTAGDSLESKRRVVSSK